MANEDRSTALVLAGGGALGAYEAGVLHYLLETLGRRIPINFDVFAGTSVGALNACFLAAYADDPALGSRKLVEHWRSVTMESVLRFGRKEVPSLLRLMRGGGVGWRRRKKERPPAAPHPPIAGIFDTSQLHDQMKEEIPWRRLQDNIDREAVRGLALCSTEVCTGRSIIFYQTSKGTDYKRGRDPMKGAKEVCITVDHAMASAAIPFVFPSVQIRGTCYTDGALRQNTPLNPALRMGADRVLVVSLTPEPSVAFKAARLGCRQNPYPGALFLLGRTLQTVLSQSLDYELNRVEMYNKLLEGGEQIYGEDFVPNLNAIVGKDRNATYRPVRTCHVRPSQNIDTIARQAMEEAPEELQLDGFAGKVATNLLNSAAFAESELLGVLMFTPTFVRALLDLGYQDARHHEEQLAQLFS